MNKNNKNNNNDNKKKNNKHARELLTSEDLCRREDPAPLSHRITDAVVPTARGEISGNPVTRCNCSDDALRIKTK